MKKVTFISIFMLLGIMVNTICAQSLKKLYFTTEQNSEKKRSVNETAYLQSKLNLSEKFTFQNKRNSTKEILAEITDSLGYTHRRYEQYYNGIKIEHSDIRVHIFNGNLVSANGEYASFEHLDTSVIITTAEALNLAKDFVRSLINDTSNNYSLNSYYNPEVVICNNRTDINDTLFHVAYKVDVYSDEHFIHEYIYVDSKNGEILNHISLIRRSNGIAATRYSGNQVISTNQVGGYYVLIDTTRGNGIKTYNLNNSTNVANAVYFTDNDNNWTANEFNNAQKDNGALDAHWGAMMTYDYFKEVHGRNSYDDNNAELINYVHYDSNYENADWGKPNISIEKKETIRKLLDTCRVGYVYEIEETCRMQSDTTYFILKSIPYKIKTTQKCEISNMKAVETISEYLNLENTSIEIFNALAENSYFIIMPEGFCNIPVSWIASVSDTHLSSDLVDSLKNLSNKEYPIYQYDKDLNEL